MNGQSILKQGLERTRRPRKGTQTVDSRKDAPTRKERPLNGEGLQTHNCIDRTEFHGKEAAMGVKSVDIPTNRETQPGLPGLEDCEALRPAYGPDGWKEVRPSRDVSLVESEEQPVERKGQPVDRE